MEFVIHIVMYAWAYLCPPIHMCINTNLHGKLPPVAPNVNALIFIVCIILVFIIFQQTTKMYDMLNKNSLGLLKKGAVKQNRINSIVKL